MRAVLGPGGITYFVNREEHEFVEEVRHHGSISREELDDRQNEIATQLVKRGVLKYAPRSEKVQVITLARGFGN